MTKLRLVGKSYIQAKQLGLKVEHSQPTLKPLVAIVFVLSLPLFFIIYTTLGN